MIFNMVSEKLCAVNVWGVVKNAFFWVNKDFGADGNRETLGMSISHVGDLLISGSDISIANFSGKLKKEFGFDVFAESESLYLGFVRVCVCVCGDLKRHRAILLKTEIFLAAPELSGRNFEFG